MSPYESLIDPTNFGTVARYLEANGSPIEYVLHTKSESMLPGLAARLDHALANHKDVGSILTPLLLNGSLRVSSRDPNRANDPDYVLAASSIPKLAYCRVIYLPPFYLCHTPGLFEGSLIAPDEPIRQGTACRRKI
jgi:hypothetical protein